MNDALRWIKNGVHCVAATAVIIHSRRRTLHAQRRVGHTLAMASDVASATMSAGRNIALAVHAATLRITSRRHSSYAASDYVAYRHRTAAKNQ